MENKEVVVVRSSLELIVIGLLAALVVLIAIPMISSTHPADPTHQQLDLDQDSTSLIVD